MSDHTFISYTDAANFFMFWCRTRGIYPAHHIGGLVAPPDARDLVRRVQELRKTALANPSDVREVALIAYVDSLAREIQALDAKGDDAA